MKKHIHKLYLSVLIVLMGCVELDLNPTSASASGNFYANDQELEIAVNDLYQKFLFKVDQDQWTDDHWQRAVPTNAITGGSINSETDFVNTYWTDLYKGIVRANTLLANMQKVKAVITPAVFNRIEGEARFLRAYFYSVLISHYGDVVFYTAVLPLSEVYALERTDKHVILEFIYDELDAAAALLPAQYGPGEIKRASKGAALGIKARIALYMGDYATTRDAAKSVMDLQVHSLHTDYRQLFLKASGTHAEFIFSIPNSIQFQQYYVGNSPTDAVNLTKNYLPRTVQGFGAWIPTWSMVDIYEAADGLPIDESPLYDPHKPFVNRDPRLAASIVPFGADWLGYTYQPHPDTLTIYSSRQGRRVSNLDNRAVAQFASYTGFIWKKGVEQSWADLLQAENDVIVLRYADVLLMYAEAKIELNEIDATVLEAVNSVRARAYGVSVSDVANYPEVTATDQAALRRVLRRERRVEFAREGLRYMDLVRWRIAEKALNTKVAGLRNPADQNRNQWPFTNTVLPEIDDDGIVKHDAVLNAGFAQLRATYVFDASRQYLWPIPANERLLNKKLTQNDNY